MSYDIPDEIKYKEKIVFGLDLRQFALACAFGLIALLSYNLPIQGSLKLVLPSIIVVIGFGFVFLNFWEKIKDFLDFRLGIQRTKPVSSKAQRLIGVKTIQNDIIYLSNGGMRTVLKVEPINFSLLDENQRKAVVLAYREFLNHLTTPIQIVVKTSRPNLNPYFRQAQARLKNGSPKLLKILKSFIKFERKFLKKNNVRTRTFYLIVTHQPAKPLLGKILSGGDNDVQRLEERTRIVQDKLAACGLKSSRLNNDDLGALLSNYSSQEKETPEAKTDEKEDDEEDE